MKKILRILFLILSTTIFSEEIPQLKDQYDMSHQLEEYKGKTIFLNFWSQHCQPCKEELPAIEALYKEYGKNKEDIIILGVTKEKSSNKVKRFMKKNGYEFPTIIDKNGQMVDEYSVKVVPTGFILNKKGEIIDHMVGKYTLDEIKEKIEKSKKDR